MPQPYLRRAAPRPSDGERIFTDGAGRLWSAARSTAAVDAAVVFQCVSDSRQAARAIAVDDRTRVSEISDDTLRRWLDAAPRLGRLV